MKKILKTILFAAMLILPFSQAWAAESYDEEITLPVGSCFDLNIPEIAGYEVDEQMVMIRNIYGKDTPVLKKVGDTIITILIKLDGNSRMRMNVMVHIVPPEQFMQDDNGGSPSPEVKDEGSKPEGSSAEGNNAEAGAKDDASKAENEKQN